MDCLRTPDDAFSGIVDFPYVPHYAEIDDLDGGRLRVAYIDEGPTDAEIILCMHGEPSWSYLYRHMIPVFVAAGYRVIAPDLVGFGRSDKPSHRSDYSYERHVGWMTGLLFDELDLASLTLVCQDWGGLLGLRIVGEHPERFASVVAANTFLPTGDRQLGAAFDAWCNFSQTVETFPTSFVINGGCVGDLTPAEMASYDAPFPDESYKEGARQFPILVPASPEDPAAPANRAAWASLQQFERPFLCAFSDGDPITAGADRVLKEQIPGASGQPHTTMIGGGHFLQEDCGPELAAVVVSFVQGT